MKDLVAKSPEISPTVSRLVAASISESTKRKYENALNRLESELPEITDFTLAHYLAERFEKGLSPRTLVTTVNAVKLRYKLTGEPSPIGPLTERTLVGMRREGRDRGTGQAVGVKWQQADLAATMAGADGTLTGLRDAAIISVASDALLRVGEVSKIQVEDIVFLEDGSAVLTIPYSKTDQEGKDCPSMYLGAPTAFRLKAWLEASKIKGGPVFRRIWVGCKKAANTLGKQPMNPFSIRRVFQERCRAAGIKGKISGHSLRVGAAQSLAASGASVVEMQTAGRWKSPVMPAHYAKGELAARGAVARLRYGQ